MKQILKYQSTARIKRVSTVWGTVLQNRYIYTFICIVGLNGNEFLLEIVDCWQNLKTTVLRYLVSANANILSFYSVMHLNTSLGPQTLLMTS